MRHLQLAWDRDQEFRGLGDPTGRYDPPLDLVKNSYPEPGKFFRPKDTNSINVSTIALRAYGEGNTANGVVAIANSTWNRSHIYYAKTGYGAYAEHLIDETGPQQELKYGTAPLSIHGSGTHWPTYWLPPLDGKPEPEEYFGWTPPADPPPPTDPGEQPPGEQGAPGVPGAQGIPGIPGAQGDQGIPGDKGDKGDRGDQGFPGDKGDKGDRGDQGMPGAGAGDSVPGEQGAPGVPGEQGIPGIPGSKGDQGFPGDKGDRGDPGIPGSPGNASQEAIAAAVQEYLENNPAITDEQLAAQIAAYMAAHPIQGSGGGGSQLPTLAAFSIMGLAMKMGIY